MASDWISANYKLFMSECCEPMYEKLDTCGTKGDGGEYGVQTGFGWTNGAILDLLVRYKDTINYTGGEITRPEKCDCEKKGPNPNNPNSNGDGNVDCQPVRKKNKNNILPFHISRGKRKAMLIHNSNRL
jgi:hypothetical protein